MFHQVFELDRQARAATVQRQERERERDRAAVRVLVCESRDAGRRDPARAYQTARGSLGCDD